jgi:DNA modification methylase
MYKTPEIDTMYKAVDFQKDIKAPRIDEIGVDLLLENRKLFTGIEQNNQSIPFGWAFAEDNFNADYEAMQINIPVTEPGDIWQLGNHRLICGNPIDIDAVNKLMDGVKARMVFTDPLWSMVYGGTRMGQEQRQIFNDKMSAEDFYTILFAVLKSIASVCESGTPAYIVMNAKEIVAFTNATNETGYHWSSTIIWGRNNHILSRKDYHEKYEPIWYGLINGDKNICPLRDRKQDDYWKFDDFLMRELHQGMKPITLATKAINNSSHTGDAVLDLFGGSGTTLLACEQSGRVGYMMELDCVYCDVILKRYINQMKTDAGVFLLRDGNKTAYNEI